jgi:hypothetical protein
MGTGGEPSRLRVEFDLAIPADDYLLLYQGQVRDVLVKAKDGRRVQFPARALQPFVEHRGVYGTFELHFSPEGKLQRLSRMVRA